MMAWTRRAEERPKSSPAPKRCRKLIALDDIPLDPSIPQELLNIEEKSRSNLFPWSGQFSPQLVDVFLDRFVRPGDHVLDPFMGSGTVLIEAARRGLAAFGSEINPAAFQMAKTYALTNVDRASRTRLLNRIENRLQDTLTDCPLFCQNGSSERSVKDALLRLWAQEQNQQARDLWETLIVLNDFYRTGLTDARVLSRWNKIRRIVEQLPFTNQPIQAAHCDARKLPIPDGEIDLVVTSPPYINVFNYHQQYRASPESLGWDLLHVARSEIGSNRKHRQNRFLTAIQYSIDTAQALAEMRRVCKRNGSMILVVGRESNVLRTPVYNGVLVVNVAIRCAGLRIDSRQVRVFKNKFGTLIYEDILHFRRGRNLNENGDSPNSVAADFLREVLDRAPKTAVAELKEAIRRSTEVKGSPLYVPRRNTLRALRREFANATP